MPRAVAESQNMKLEKKLSLFRDGQQVMKKEVEKVEERMQIFMEEFVSQTSLNQQKLELCSKEMFNELRNKVGTLANENTVMSKLNEFTQILTGIQKRLHEKMATKQ